VTPFALRRGVSALASSQMPKILLRTFFGLITLYCVSFALASVSLSEVVLLNNTSPLFVPLIVMIWDKVKIPLKVWLSVFIGFIGVVVILRPGFAAWNEGIIVALFSGVSSALLLVVMRKIAHEPLLRLLFYYFLWISVGLLPFLFFEWKPVPPSLWLYLILAAMAMIGGQLTFSAAFRFASTHDIAPSIYTSVLFAGLIDWIVWGTTPDILSVAGMGIVIMGCILTLLINPTE